jgi:hypothetical protein
VLCAISVICSGDGCGRVVKVIDFKPLLLTAVNSIRSARILSCEKAIQLAYGMSVVLLRCLSVPETIHKGAPEVLFLQVKLENRHLTYTVFV